MDKASITNGSRSRWLLVAGFFAVLGVAASQPGPSTPPPTLAERTLPDGTVLSFERLTVEHSDQFLEGKWLGRLVGQEVLGPGDFLRCRFRQRPDYTRLILGEVAAVDEHGCELAPTLHSSEVQYPGGGQVTLLRIDRFPRRQQAFGLRLYGRQLATNVQVAEFEAQNPITESFPVWQAEALPNRKTDRDLSIKLLEVSTGHASPDGGLPDRVEPVKRWTRLTLDLQALAGHPRDWQLGGVRTSDATGNRWRNGPGQSKQTGFTEEGRRVLWICEALCPHEAAWKVRLEYLRQPTMYPELAAFERGEPGSIWELKGLPVPAVGKSLEVSRRTVLEGVEVELYRVSREATATNSMIGMELYFRDFGDRVDRNLTMTVLRGRDSKGGRLQAAGWTFGGTEHRTGVSTLTPGATAVDVTVAGTASRVFEFLVKPRVL